MQTSELMGTLRSLWLVWLIILFAGIVWWVYRKKNKARFDEAALIPFKDENGGQENGR